jgi:hypothetical protein
MELRQRAYEDGIAAEKLRIFVKARNHAAMVSEDVINAEYMKSGAYIRIEVFGFEDEIFTVDRIVNEDMDILAKHIAENYSADAANEYPASWNKLINHERDSNRYAALSIRAKLNLMGFDLTYDETGETCQDEDVLKGFAESYGLERALKLRKEKAYLEYPERTAQGKIMDSIRNNLARLEHQRWNSYYLVNGWMPLDKSLVTAKQRKDQRARKHACVTTFEGLEELAKTQAELRTGGLAAKEQEETYKINLKDCDTMHMDFDQLDCLLGNLKNTRYRIVKGISKA